MTTTVYEYRIFCITENTWKYTWGLVPPTTCPTNTADAVNPASVQQVDSISNDTVTINKIRVVPPNYTPLGGYYRMTCQAFTANPNSTTTSTFSFPYPIAIMSGYILTDTSMQGDIISIGAGYGSTVATLTSSANIGDTTIAITPSIIGGFYMRTGGYMRITDGTNTTAYSIVTSQNTNTGTITLATPISYNFNTGAFVQVAIVFMDNVTLGPAGSYRVGEYAIGASYVNANTTFQITYTTTSISSKPVSFIFDYLY